MVRSSSWCYPAFNLAKKVVTWFRVPTPTIRPLQSSLSLPRIRVSSHLTFRQRQLISWICKRRAAFSGFDRLSVFRNYFTLLFEVLLAPHRYWFAIVSRRYLLFPDGPAVHAEFLVLRVLQQYNTQLSCSMVFLFPKSSSPMSS